MKLPTLGALAILILGVFYGIASYVAFLAAAFDWIPSGVRTLSGAVLGAIVWPSVGVGLAVILIVGGLCLMLLRTFSAGRW